MNRNIVIATLGLAALVSACNGPRQASSAGAAPAAAMATPMGGAVIQSPAGATANGRVSGTIQRVDGDQVTLQSGERFAVTSDARIIRSVPVDPTTLQPGDFVAVTAKRQPDNTLLASIVNIFPDSMRGLGIGQRPMDDGNLMTNATISDGPNLMTNATIDTASGRSFSVTFPDGNDEVHLADDAKVNQFEAADTSALTTGASISASVTDGNAQFLTIL
jgi:hypothetical protein